MNTKYELMDKNPQVIGIRFCDNDFYMTITSFLEMIGKIGIQEYTPLTKERFVELYNRSIVGFYWIAQNKLGYRDDWEPSDYLNITEKNVYFDKEVDLFLKENKNGYNGEFFVLDTSAHEPYIYNW